MDERQALDLFIKKLVKLRDSRVESEATEVFLEWLKSDERHVLVGKHTLLAWFTGAFHAKLLDIEDTAVVESGKFEEAYAAILSVLGQNAPEGSG